VSTQRRLVLTFSIVLLAASVSTATSTTTVFDNFGPEWDYNTGLGWTVAGPESGNDFGVEQAMGFVPEVGGIMVDVWVAMAYVPFDHGPDVVTLRLATDEDGQPGVVLEEWIFTEIEDWNQWNPPLHGEGSGSSLLEAGTLYWLWAVANDSTWVMWNMNNVGDVGPHTLRREGEDWLPVSQETRSAFRVDVEDVTGIADGGEPATGGHLEVWPNPGSGEMCIRYRGEATSGPVELAIFDVLGRKIRTIFDWGATSVSHEVIWDGRSQDGEAVGTGVYWVRLAQPDRVETIRVLRIQ
jgi:hypothetical protein